MNAKELYDAYESFHGKNVVLHITQGELAERKEMSIRIVKPRESLKYVDVYLFRFEDDCLVMFANSHDVIYNLLMNPAFEEDE